MVHRGFLLFGLLLTVACFLAGQTPTTDIQSRDSVYVR